MKILNMVGTSLFTNFIENNENANGFNAAYKFFLESNNRDRIRENLLNNTLDRYINDKIIKINNLEQIENISAEIKSLNKILQREKIDEGKIFLFSSDTILSKIATEKIKNILNRMLKQRFDIVIENVENLKIDTEENFKTGLNNLLNKINLRVVDFNKPNWEDIIINITGGYKAIIPYLTIIAQHRNCKIYYIFEETDTLLNVPIIPIKFDYEIIERNYDFLRDLPRNLQNNETIPEELEGLIERADNSINLNIIGKDLFNFVEQIRGISVEINIDIDRENEGLRETINDIRKKLLSNPTSRDLNHGLVNVNLPAGYKCYRKNNIAVLYNYNENERRLKIAYYNKAHNANNEYVRDIQNIINRINNIRYKNFN